jgi:hypothetical protein
MITTRTVFVLGAGASMPYGFPSGADLRHGICTLCDNPGSKFSLAAADVLGVSADEVRDFGVALRTSMQPSIDSFLARRGDLAAVGKLAIAYEICRREKPEHVTSGGDGDDWYLELWRAMTADALAPRQVVEDQVRFVTFNYDRSLEQLFHGGLVHTYGIGDAEALDIVRELHICHVYGQVGRFETDPYLPGRPFTSVFSNGHLKLAAEGIRVIPEARDDDTEFQTARTWFEWAERICFLGFGFDPLNMRRLGISEVAMAAASHVDPSRRRLSITASVKGLTDIERDARVVSQMLGASSLNYFDERNLMTLRKSGILLR